MLKINENYRNLKESYLFSEIAKRVKEYQDANPDKKVIRMGIGDVSLPLCPAVVDEMQQAALGMGMADTFHGYGPELGCAIRATGSNSNMSRAQGINTDRMKIFGLMLSNGIVAFASGLYAQYQGFSEINAGRGAIVIGLAAVIIGEVIFGKISPNFAFKLLSVVLGAIIYYLVLQVVLWLGLNSNDLKLLSAVVVAVFLAVPYMKGRYFSKPVKKGGGSHA